MRTASRQHRAFNGRQLRAGGRRTRCARCAGARVHRVRRCAACGERRRVQRQGAGQRRGREPRARRAAAILEPRDGCRRLLRQRAVGYSEPSRLYKRIAASRSVVSRKRSYSASARSAALDSALSEYPLPDSAAPARHRRRSPTRASVISSACAPTSGPLAMRSHRGTHTRPRAPGPRCSALARSARHGGVGEANSRARAPRERARSAPDESVVVGHDACSAIAAARRLLRSSRAPPALRAACRRPPARRALRPPSCRPAAPRG